MSIRHLVLALALSVPLAGYAETPNVQPGQWEYVNKTSFKGQMGIPDQEHSHTECVTLDQIERGRAFLDDMPDECEISNMEMGQSAMSYDMACTQPGGTRMDMSFNMEFMGDRVDGVVTGDMETPMGQMNMNVDVQGRRVGDC